MAKVYVFLANGFEDIEALAPIDILRRGGMEVTTVSIHDSNIVTSAHEVSIIADTTFDQVGSFEDADLLILPGGMPGAQNLKDHQGLSEVILRHNERGGLLGAICAAPMILGGLGLLRGRRATCYPGFEAFLEDADYTAELVTVDGNITTGKGPGAAMAFGYQLLSHFTDNTTVTALQQGMMYR